MFSSSLAVLVGVTVCALVTSTHAQDLNRLRCELKIQEGVRYKVYIDTAGYATAGIGHKLTAAELRKYPVGSTITEAQLTSWFESDIAVAVSGAISLLGASTFNDLVDTRKRATANLIFNLGQTKLAQFKDFVSGMKTGDYNRAADPGLKQSKWYRQVGVRGDEIIAQIRDARNTGRIVNC